MPYDRLRRGAPVTYPVGKLLLMKYLVLSDSHGRTASLEAALFSEKTDAVIFLGDGLSDIEEAMNWFPGRGLVAVRGNCDGWRPDSQTELLIEAGGCRLFLCHGHTQDVKEGLWRLCLTARDRGAGVALFGHTHEPVCRRRDGILLLNPGSVGFDGSYALLTVENGAATAVLKKTETL